MQGRRKSGFLSKLSCSLTNKLYGVTPFVFSILYIRTVYSPSQRFWWMRHWSVQWSFLFLRGKALWEGRLWCYPRMGEIMLWILCQSLLTMFSSLISRQGKGLTKTTVAVMEQDNLQYVWLISFIHIVVLPKPFADCKGTLDLVWCGCHLLEQKFKEAARAVSFLC